MHDHEADALREVLNIGVGRAAAALSDMVGAEVALDVPRVRLSDRRTEAPEFRGCGRSMVELPFEGDVDGSAALVFLEDSAGRLVGLLAPAVRREGPPEATLREVVLTEVGNLVLNHVLGTLGDVCGRPFEYQPPRYRSPIDGFYATDDDAGEQRVLLADAHFAIAEKEIEGDILIVCPLDALPDVVATCRRILDGAGIAS